MTATYFNQWTAEERSPYPREMIHEDEDKYSYLEEDENDDSDTFGGGCFDDLDIGYSDFW